MAHTKAAPGYTRHYTVSSDAIAKVKSLVKNGRFAGMTDLEVNRILDSATYEAVQLGQYETIMDSVGEEPRSALLVTLPAEKVAKGVYAVVHEDRFHKPGTPKQIILAVLDGGMVELNRQNGKWSTKYEPQKPMVSLVGKLDAGKLEAMRAHLVSSAAAAPTVPAPVPGLGGITKQIPVQDRYRVDWVQFASEDDDEGTDMSQVFIGREAFDAQLDLLANDDLADVVNVFQEVYEPTWKKMRTKKKLVIE